MVKQKRILLIEDEFFIHELYKRSLTKAGFDVITAYDGEEGLRLAKKEPHLILLDVMLPKMHGINVLKKIKA